MPDRTPAELMTAAADRLDALIAVATPAPWTQQHGPLPTSSSNWVRQGANWDLQTRDAADAAYIAAMNPDVGRALAALLRRHGQIAVGWTDTEEVFPEELRLARAILGTGEGT